MRTILVIFGRNANEKVKNCIFSLKSLYHCFPGFYNLLLDLFNLLDLQFILMLLYDFLNLVINGDQLWVVGWSTAQEKESWEFCTALVALCCACNAPVCSLAERLNCHLQSAEAVRHPNNNLHWLSLQAREKQLPFFDTATCLSRVCGYVTDAGRMLCSLPRSHLVHI